MDKGQFLLYQTPDGNSQIEVKLQNDTVWLSLDQMAELFQRNKSTISRHIKNVLEDGELQEEATIANFATVQNEGTRKVERVITRVRDNILKSKEQKNIQPTKGGHKMVTCQNYVSLFYCQITSCPSDGGIS